MITPAQCRAARALAELTRGALSRLAGIEESAIERFERRIDEPDEQTVTKLRDALEEAGIVFIVENGGGAGVRLKFNNSVTRRLGVLEGEGGMVRNDDVP